MVSNEGLHLEIPSASRLPAFDAEILRAFDDFVGPSDVDVAPQGSLYDFVRTFWTVVEPSQPFVDNWHIQKICKVLEAVTKGEITHVLINIPPGCMKSLIVSVFWPAWEWAHDPGLRFLTASYGEDLSIRDARKTRDIITSREYQDRWPHVRIRSDQNQKRRFDTTSGGWRLATSVDGRGTGEHPDRIIVDDPHNVKEAISDAERQRGLEWFDGTISTRGVARNARVVVIMQRLHEKDLAGHILSRADSSRWLHICLPMMFEPARMRPNALGFTDERTVPGELLWPALFTGDTLKNMAASLGSFRAAGQLQQRPAPAEGGIIKRGWWKFYSEHAILPLTQIVISCDPNLKAKQLNDFAAIHAWGAIGGDRYFLRRARGRWDLPELTRQVDEMYRFARERWPNLPITTLVENTAAGPDVVALLQRKIPGVIPITPKGDKVQRTQAVTPAIEAGNVFVPGAASPTGEGEDTARTPLWVQEFLAECAGFPLADYDDDVDAMSQALLRLQSGGSYVATINTPASGPGAGVSHTLSSIRERKTAELRRELEAHAK